MSSIDDQAARWVLCRENGLSPAQQDDLSDWLAASPAHREAYARQQGAWSELDRLCGLQESLSSGPDPDLLAPAETAEQPSFLERRPAWSSVLAVAASLTLLFGGLLWRQGRTQSSTTAGPAATVNQACEQRLLEDGSEVTLAPGACLELRFTAHERRVLLSSGQAFFKVAKNPARPFVVATNTLEAVAIGTAFNVRVEAGEVEVFVSEGRVRMDQPGSAAPGPMVDAGGAALASSASAPLSIRSLDTEQSARVLSWQPRLLDFENEPLDLVLGEFNRCNHLRLRTDDPRLGRLRITASLRSDNVSGFLRLLESAFGVTVSSLDGDLVLHQEGDSVTRE